MPQSWQDRLRKEKLNEKLVAGKFVKNLNQKEMIKVLAVLDYGKHRDYSCKEMLNILLGEARLSIELFLDEEK